MKTLLSTKTLTLVITLGLAMVFTSGDVYGQKAPKRNGKHMPEATLSEAKVVAKLSTNVFEVQPLKLRLYLLNPSGKRVLVGIRNYNNEVVFADTFFAREYLRNFDFTTMLNGTYKLRIDNRKEHLVKPFAIQEVVSRNIVQTGSNQEAPSNFVAKIYQSEQAKVKIHLNNASGQVVEILVRNEADEIVYRGFESGKQITKVLEMTPLADGKYTLLLKNHDEKVSRNFEIITTREKSFAWLDKSGNPIQQDRITAFNR